MVHEHFKKQLIESIELPFQEHDLEKNSSYIYTIRLQDFKMTH